MSKKTLTITAGILVLLLVLFLGYYFFFRTVSVDQNGNPTTGFSLFPLGNGNAGAPNTNGNGTTTGQPQINQNNPLAKLRKLSSEPVSGAGTLDFKAGTVVRYIERGTGHIFEVELFSANQNRISNTTLPLAYDALWGNKNNSLIARYLKEDNQSVDTFSLTLKSISTSTENAVSAIALPSGISDVSVFGSSVFYLQQSPNSSSGVITSFTGTSKKQIWSSPIKDLNSQYVSANIVALTTKPAQNLPGFLYFVNTTSGQVRKVLSDVPGLSTLASPDGTKVLYIEQGNGMKMSLRDIATRANTPMTPSTFPEKCVWSIKNRTVVYCAVPRETLGGSSLTLWYQGFVSFTDDIWKYDTKNNTSSVIESLLDDSGEAIDVVKPILSENEQYLVFINKRDNALWSLDLTK